MELSLEPGCNDNMSRHINNLIGTNIHTRFERASSSQLLLCWSRNDIVWLRRYSPHQTREVGSYRSCRFRTVLSWSHYNSQPCCSRLRKCANHLKFIQFFVVLVVSTYYSRWLGTADNYL